MSEDRTLEGLPPPKLPSEEDDVPVQVGDYLIEAKVGEGGGGMVFKARHRLIGSVVAIKLMRVEHVQSKEMVKRFVQEAQAVNQIRHPNLVDVFDYGVTPNGRPYLCMEFLEGETLRDLLCRRGRMSPLELVQLMVPLCHALHAAHQAGFIHRDVKASNVMLVKTPTGAGVKLLDFGIAKYLHADPTTPGLTRAGTRMGTPSAMAPEQIRGETVDARTDVYGLGILIFDALTGERPFSSVTSTLAEQEEAHLYSPPPVPSQRSPVPPGIDAVVLRCLAKNPQQRFSSPLAVLEALTSAVQPELTNVSSEGLEQALAVHFEVRAPEDEALAETTEGDVEDALMDVGARLRAAGFVVPMETSNSVLAVWRGRVTSATLLGMREAMTELRTRLGKTATPVDIMACAHSGRLSGTSGADGFEVTGGPLLKVRSWAPTEPRVGLWGTQAAADALGVQGELWGDHVRLG